MKNGIEFKKNMKTGSEGSSLAIALFFFLLCSLICAGVLYVANSSIVGVSKHFNGDDVPTFIAPAPIPTNEPTITPDPVDPVYQGEADAIDYVYNTLVYDIGSALAPVPNGGEGYIYWHGNPRSLSYEVISYVNAYFGVVYRGNKYLSLSDLNNGDKYFVEVDAAGDMLPKEFVVTVYGYNVKVVIDLDGTKDSKYNTILKFNTINITVSGANNSGCTYYRQYTKTYPGDGYYYLKWVNGNPKRFVIKNFKW